jgi:hypothetical protein
MAGKPKYQNKKRLFDDRVPTTRDGQKREANDIKAAQLRVEKLHSHINYRPRERYPVRCNHHIFVYI